MRSANPMTKDVLKTVSKSFQLSAFVHPITFMSRLQHFLRFRFSKILYLSVNKKNKIRKMFFVKHQTKWEKSKMQRADKQKRSQVSLFFKLNSRKTWKKVESKFLRKKKKSFNQIPNLWSSFSTTTMWLEKMKEKKILFPNSKEEKNEFVFSEKYSTSQSIIQNQWISKYEM